MTRIQKHFHCFIGLFLILFFIAGCQSQTKIANNLPAREANEIVVLLNSRGIAAAKAPAVTSTVGGGASTEQLWDIAVPSNQITEALSILNQSGLPRTRGTTLLDLFGAKGLVPSDMQDRIRYQEGLSEQLAATIRKMDGVIDANVQISFPADEEAGHKPLTASVYIKHQGILDNPNSLLVTKIKRLVSSAVPGLSPDNVSVVTDRAVYSDITLRPGESVREDEKEYVSIWSIIIAKASVTRFRVVFYSFIILIFLLLCLILWILWKLHRVIESRGGYRILFTPHQIEPAVPPSAEETIVEEEEGL